MTRSGHAPRLIVMTRYPRAGAVKSRLAASVGDARAAELHSDIARYCVRRMHAVAISGDVELEVRVTGAGPSETRGWLRRKVRVRPQSGEDLGARLSDAFATAFAEGAPSAMAVGSDAPGLSGAHVRDALGALAQTDVVLGPALDGGYYLVGIRTDAASRALPDLFGSQIQWGSPEVLETTLATAERAGLTVTQISPLADIDRPEDLELWSSLLADQARAQAEPRLSVLIPTLDEEENIEVAVQSALEAGADEVIVADGGSVDRTIELAEASGATVFTAPAAGRAAQINAAAARASGDILLMLHADSRAPASALSDIRDVMADPDVVLGSFRFEAGDPERLSDRFMSWVGRTRHGVFKLPFGDQGQFIRRADFEDLGGMPQMPTMEDYEFALGCRRLGSFGVTKSRLWTSGRGWDEHGIVRVAVVNSAVIVGYRMGVGTDRLAAWRSSIADRRQDESAR